jgi:carbonic anhydrase
MDTSMMSVLQFAVESLKVPHIVVCGHYECGGVKASSSQVDHKPPLSVWLRNIRDVQVCRRDPSRQTYGGPTHLHATLPFLCLA